MKKIWLIGLLGLLVACNNEASTRINDTDHTMNRDSATVDSTKVIQDTSKANTTGTIKDSSR